MRKQILIAAAIGMFIHIATPVKAADIVIGVPNWSTVKMTAHILEAVIEDNMGLDVELQSGTNPVIFEAMEEGSMHIHPEVWLPNQNNLHTKYVKEEKTVRFSPNGVPGYQIICATEDARKATGIKKLTDLTDPEIARQFDNDGDGKGELYIGAPGWASTLIERIRAKTYGYDETMELQEFDEAIAYGNLDNTVAAGKNWVGYCYTPHHLFKVHDLYILEEPKYDAAKWNIVKPADDPDWLAKSEAGTAWDVAYLHVHYATKLENTHPQLAAMLANIALTTEHLDDMAYADAVNKVDPKEYAQTWIIENAALIANWLK